MSGSPSGPTGCLDEAVLRALVVGSLPEARVLELQEHLRGCDGCRGRLQHLADELDSGSTLPRRRPRTDGEWAGCPVRAGDVVADKYVVERPLGRGAMGVVVAALHRGLNEQVALKFSLVPRSRDRQAASRFAREARAAVRLKSPHVCRVIDLGELPDGTQFIVMERLTGESLEHRLLREGPQAEANVRRWALAVARALREAHALGIVHRDLKPANLFLHTEPGGQETLKILDFGVARSQNAAIELGLEQTRTPGFVGSPAYMAPEQFMTPALVDARADLWSLGATIVHLCTGKLPFHGDSLVAIARQVCEQPPRFEGVPAGLVPIVQRCLARRPDDRFPSAQALEEALEGRTALEALPTGPPAPAARRRTLAIAAVASLVLVAALVPFLSGAWGKLRFRRTVERAEAAMRMGSCEEARELLLGADERVDPAARPEAAVVMAVASTCFGGDIGVPQIRVALELDQPPARRVFLEGLLAFARSDFAQAEAVFRRALEAHPDDVYLLYGLMEATFHRNAPEAALEATRRLLELDPDWRLGLEHARDWANVHGDLPLMTSMLRTSGFQASPYAEAEQVLPLVMRRRYAEAYAELQRTHVADPRAAKENWQGLLRVKLAVLAGDQPYALGRLFESAEFLPQAASGRYALARLVGDEALTARARDELLAAPGNALTELALIDLPDATRAARNFARLEGKGGGLTGITRVLLARQALAAGDGAPLAEVKPREGESHRAFVEAVEAEQAGRWAEAAKAWEAAAQTQYSDWVTFGPWLFAAEDAEKAGELERAVELCDRVARPRSLIGWSFALTGQACQLLIARVQLRLNRPAEAKAALAAVRAARSKAGPDDEGLKNVAALEQTVPP
jgi:tetratricopeptide (TPR) repeat protein